MHSIERYDDIWAQGSDADRRMYDGVSRPYKTPLDPIQKLPENPNPPFRLKINLKTGEMTTEILRD